MRDLQTQQLYSIHCMTTQDRLFIARPPRGGDEAFF